MKLLIFSLVCAVSLLGFLLSHMLETQLVKKRVSSMQLNLRKRVLQSRDMQAGLRDRDPYWKRADGPERIKMCGRDEAFARTRFAVVSLLTVDAQHMYTESAMKLATSLRWWLPQQQMDLVMLLTEGFGVDGQVVEGVAFDRMTLDRAGWNVLCRVPKIVHPTVSDGNRFHEAALYSKLNAWGLTEYDAILYLDSDTLVVRSPLSLFTFHLPAMLFRGSTLGACRDRPAKFSESFNGGVLLIIPGKGPAGEDLSPAILQHSIGTVPHVVGFAEQGLLNAMWGQHGFYELPYVFNANLVSKYEEPALWLRNVDRLVIVHYTVAKGWQSLRFFQLNDMFTVWWCYKWSIDDYCRLWESVSIKP